MPCACHLSPPTTHPIALSDRVRPEGPIVISSETVLSQNTCGKRDGENKQRYVREQQDQAGHLETNEQMQGWKTN